MQTERCQLSSPPRWIQNGFQHGRSHDKQCVDSAAMAWPRNERSMLLVTHLMALPVKRQPLFVRECSQPFTVVRPLNTHTTDPTNQAFFKVENARLRQTKPNIRRKHVVSAGSCFHSSCSCFVRATPRLWRIPPPDCVSSQTRPCCILCAQHSA